MMDEHIRTVFLLNEAVSFPFVKPFYCTFCLGFVKGDWAVLTCEFFSDLLGHIPDVVVAKNGVQLEIIYYCHLIEKARFS